MSMRSVSTSSLRVAAMPLMSCRGDAARNVERVADSLAQAASHGVTLAVFPETCLCGYGSFAKLTRLQLDALAEPLDGASLRAVADAVDRSGVAAGVGLIERAPDGRLFDSYVVCLPGGVRYAHRKLHAFEHRRIASGDRFTVFDTAWGVRIGILIGADNYLVDNMRTTALMGATLLIAPHRTYGATRDGGGPLQPLSAEVAPKGQAGVSRLRTDTGHADAADAVNWLRRRLPARAADNGMFVVFSNGGDEPADDIGHVAHVAHVARTGGLIVDPDGRVLADSGCSFAAQKGANRALICADLDTALIASSDGQRWLGARRPDLYSPLSQSERRAATSFDARGVAAKGSVALSFASVARERLVRG